MISDKLCVRGKSKVIIFARAFVISCVAVGVPAFGIYSIVIVPLNAEVYTKSIIHSTAIWNRDAQALTGNASIYLVSGIILTYVKSVSHTSCLSLGSIRSTWF